MRGLCLGAALSQASQAGPGQGVAQAAVLLQTLHPGAGTPGSERPALLPTLLPTLLPGPGTWLRASRPRAAP